MVMDCYQPEPRAYTATTRLATSKKKTSAFDPWVSMRGGLKQIDNGFQKSKIVDLQVPVDWFLPCGWLYGILTRETEA